jgi:diguanylate cyclase (GGDEF)-like protein/PAS domain S-box-containing protein
MSNPLTRWLGRLSVGRKLLVIYLLDLSAVIFISGILINEKFIAIDFGRKEMAGIAYIDELRPSLLALAGWRGARPASDAQLATVEHAHGGDLRSAERSVAFRQAVERVARSTATDPERTALERAALESGRALITRVGNQSNLILDPDLDSYYTMSLVLLRFPELLELVSALDAHLGRTNATPAENAESHMRYFVLEGRVDAVARAIQTDYGEAFAAAAGPLRSRLDDSRERLRTDIAAFQRAARTALDGSVDDRSSGFEAARQSLLANLDRAWAGASAELETLLKARERGFFMRMWLHLGTALFLLLLILSAVYHVARQIALPLAQLSGVVDTVRRTGDHGLRARWDSGDEIGRLVVGFNDMLAQLDRERRIQQELAASARAAEAQRDLVAAIPIPIMVTAVPGHEVLDANPQARAWLDGREGDPWAGGLEPTVRARFFQQLADRDAVDEFEVRWNGGQEPSWAVLSARRFTYQGRDAVLTAFTPINHLKQMEQRLELWAKVFEASSEGIMIIDARHAILTVNRALTRHTAHDARELVGATPDCVLAGATLDEPGFWHTLDRRGAWQGEATVRRRNGTTYPAWLVASVVRDGPDSVSHYIFTSIDISDRKRSEERIRYLALHDVLTELPNRFLCVERLGRAIREARHAGRRVGVLFLDLDRFKVINDSLGHHVGDALLKSVARRLLEAVRPDDTVSRLGGDEFVVVLRDVADGAEVLGLVERLVPAVRRAHDIDGVELHVSCSVGIALYPEDGADIDELMRHADVAMYQSKAGGRDMSRFFTPEMNERARRRQRIESNLRHAVERAALRLAFQPRVDARSGRAVGVEALLRWHDGELGAVPPAEFIPVAEESGQIVGLGAWVIEQACAQHAAWRDDGLGEVPVSINVSALQLRDPALLDTLGGALRRHGVAPTRLEIELTESTLMDTSERTLAPLRALKALGVRLSIDDFGTGYSSLAYLHRFPIDMLKIDRSFVHRMLDDPTHLAIVRAVIGLGHTLGLRVVAEGVESAQAAQALREARCDELQGFHFARPMDADALGAWLAAERERRAVA